MFPTNPHPQRDLEPEPAHEADGAEQPPVPERHTFRMQRVTPVAPDETLGDIYAADPAIRSRGVNVHYGSKQALFNINLDVGRHEVIALIGPSGCGKSTFLRCLNRMNDTIDGCRVTGQIHIDSQDVYAPSLDVVQLRARVGMVFQKPNPFPKSIYDNVAYGPRIHGLVRTKADTDDLVERSLSRAGLFEEVKDRLHSPGTGLSGG